MRDESTSERGVITAFVVALSTTFLVVAGLAVDSGRIVAARITVADHAENAARVGAQQVGGIRSGERVLDPARARRAALEYLSEFGLSAEITVEVRRIRVTTHMTQPTTLLQLVGIGAQTVSATRTAELVDR